MPMNRLSRPQKRRSESPTSDVPSKQRSRVFLPRHAKESPTKQAYARNSETNLLSLPRELRDEIYSFAWAGTNIYYRHKNIFIRVWRAKSKHARAIRGLPHWIRTSSQLLSEALEVIRRKYVYGLDKLMLSYSMTMRLRKPRRSNLAKKYDNKLLMNSMRNVDINAHYMDHAFDSSVAPYDDVEIQQFAALVRKRLPHMSVSVSMLWDLRWHARTEIDYSALALLLRSCDRVQITLWGFASNEQEQAFLLERLQSAEHCAKDLTRGGDESVVIRRKAEPQKLTSIIGYGRFEVSVEVCRAR